MPIKTIQPFVSDFNAFAGEGFYGNVVQGLVIKQLEDVVFIFGIAIDGTLIFRKRNYPDVSTWEDPKIIIHSNNWHKIYLKRELGGLIGVATATKNGLLDKKYSTGNISMQGMVIDFKVEDNVFYTTSSIIELYVYSTGMVGYYRILTLPEGSSKIKIKYLGQNCCDFKFSDNKLYVLPNNSDITITYRFVLGRRYVPIFSSVPISDFTNITGDIITPTEE